MKELLKGIIAGHRSLMYAVETAAVNREPEKIQFEWNSNLCDTYASIYQLSYQGNEYLIVTSQQV